MIVVVGGGLSGLAVAHHLRKRGVEHLLFEAEPEPGGVVRTEVVAGIPLDIGPQRTRLTRPVRRLVQESGLEDELVTADEDLPLYVYRSGRLRRVPFGIWDALRTDLLGWTGKLRILLEPLTRGLDPDETVADFFTRKFGREAYENLIGPLYGGLYASDPARMYARHGLRITLEHFGVEGSLLLAMLRRGEKARSELETVSFRDGMQALPRALVRLNREHVRLGMPVVGLEPGDEMAWRLRVARPGDHGPGADGRADDLGRRPPPAPQTVRVSRAGADPLAGLARAGEVVEAVEADAVVLACPAPVAARLLSDLAEQVAPDQEGGERTGVGAEGLRGVASGSAACLSRLNYNPLAVVHLQAGCELEGLGYQVAFGEALETRGVTWNASMFDRDGIYTAYLGGMKHPGLVVWPDGKIADVAAREFEEVTGCTAEVLRVSRTHIPAWDGSWDALASLELPEGIHLCNNWSARPGIPGRIVQAERVAGEAVADA